MDKNDLDITFLGRILRQTGGYFLVLAVFFSQLIPSLLAIPIAMFVQTNAELTKTQVRQAGLLLVGTIVLGNIILLAWSHLFNTKIRHQIRKALGEGKTAATDLDMDEERLAWRQITSFAWRYGIASAVVLLIIVALPITGFFSLFLKASNNQLIYTLMGAGVYISMTLALSALSIDRLLAPARWLILPTDFEIQLSSSAGSRLLIKFVVVILIMVLISVLLVAPVGYHSTISVLVNGVIGTQGALHRLQGEIIVAAIVAIAFGFGLALLLSRSVSDPINQIIAALKKVETGDLKQRLNVNATDEVGELAAHFNRMISRLDSLQATLENQVTERTDQLKATIEVSRVASTILDPDELVKKVVNLINDRFGYYYVALFLKDESGQWAVLKDATGTAGQTLLKSGHRLFIGGNSMVGSAISMGEARIALDVGEEPVRFENPLLPETHSEIALPLSVGGRIIGAMDVQSKDKSAFSEQDVGTFQSMANSVATALENAHLFHDTQSNLEELRGIQREYVAASWSGSVREHEGYEYTSSEASVENEQLSMIDVPLTLREQIIGQLHLEGQQDWTPEERNLVEAVATQAALAMENARLLEDSRLMAQRERLAAEITGKVWSSANTDIILQTAVKELGRVLHADEATIELKSD